MFLTQIHVDARTAMGRYGWHKNLWNAFGDLDGQRPFIYRVDSGHTGHKVLMASTIEPMPQDWGTWETKPVDDRFPATGPCLFQLRAHVVKRSDDGERFVTDSAELTAWLATRLDANGAQLVQADAAPPVIDQVRKPGRTIKLNRVDFFGVLNVKAPAAVRQALVAGIGRGRAFGFGMLQLKRI